MKQIVCDNCGEVGEMPVRSQISPDGWGRIGINLSMNVPYRSVSEQIDWCRECIRKRFPKIEDKQETPEERLIEFIREWINDEVSDAMENQ